MEEIEVTVLGSCGGYPSAGRACSGFLVRSAEGCIVLDMGNGTLSNLQEHLPWEKPGGVLLSHLHPDHFLDLYPYYTARRFSLRPVPSLPVIGPAGSRERVAGLLAETAFQGFFESFDWEEVGGGRGFEIAGFRVETCSSLHTVEGLCFRVSAGPVSICYSGDTGPVPGLVELASGVDLFLCEATFTSQMSARPEGHLFAREAGAIAAEAGVRQLVLVHLWPAFSRRRALEDACRQFDGPVHLAEEGRLFSAAKG